MTKKTILAGITAFAILSSACGSGANSTSSVSPNTPLDSTGPAENNPGQDEATTSGENDPRPPDEVEKPTSGPAFGASKAETKALISSADQKQQESAEVFKEVDFLNFTYKIGEPGNLKVEVTDGEFFDEEERVFFTVTDIQYGDIGGDTSPEAIVYVLYNTGGTGQFTDALVYGMNGEAEPSLIATAGAGDRAFGGIESGTIEGGKLLLARLEGPAACCPSSVNTFAHRDWKDGRLIVVGEPQKEAFVSFDVPNVGSYESDPRELRFLPGTSSARIFGSGDSKPLTFEAQKGQKTTITVFSTTFGEVKLHLKDAQTGKVLGEVTAGTPLVVVLPNDGDYVLAPSVVSAELDVIPPGFDARIEIR